MFLCGSSLIFCCQAEEEVSTWITMTREKCALSLEQKEFYMPSQNIWTKCFRDTVNQQMVAKCGEMRCIYLLPIEYTFSRQASFVGLQLCSWQFSRPPLKSSSAGLHMTAVSWQSLVESGGPTVPQSHACWLAGLTASPPSLCGLSFSRRLAWTSHPH